MHTDLGHRNEAVRRRNGVVRILAIVASISGVGAFIYSLRPATDLGPAVAQANKLIAGAGGPAKVCDEGNQILKRFGTETGRLFDLGELKDYPAIAALGEDVNLLPGSPSRLLVRIGTHLDGFTIEIADRGSPAKVSKSAAISELVESCVFVHR